MWDLDRILNVVENPVRRKIIDRLSQEPSYTLELSSDLGVHQQLVTKHLKMMEETGFVEAKRESSPHGPDRRVYGLTRSMSLTVDFSPDLYKARMSSFEDIPIPSKYGEVRERLERISTTDQGAQGVNPYAQLIADIDRRLNELESERDVLLYLRSEAIRSAKEAVKSKGVSVKEMKVVYHILNKHEKSANAIARSLDVREEVVTRILDRLREESILR